MSATTKRRAYAIFTRASELPAEERAEFVDTECGDHERLRAEVTALLESLDGVGDFLGRPAVERVTAAGPGAAAPLAAGTRVGSFEVMRPLGEGAGGMVYEALQATPRRRVALKVMRRGLLSDRALHRFRSESEILARLKHPDVAHVYESGVQEIDGADVPYIALELVEGARDLVRYCDERALSVRERVVLLSRACRAVHHGHQKGIIHRDVKPGNVLVDDEGRLRVIDFGVARSEETPDDDAVVGTLAYMSPEQCDAAAEAIDVQSDVYSLGVLAYEVLSGRLPYDVDGLPFAAAVRVICERAPAPMRIADAALHGDLEAIVCRALEKRRELRYASAAEFAADLDRALSDEPVTARRHTLPYVLLRFARRRRLAAAALVAVVVVSVAAALVAAHLAREYRDQREDAAFQAYVANLAAASAALREHSVAEARQRLDAAPKSLRGWEWRLLDAQIDHGRRLFSHDSLFWALRVSPLGDRFVVSGSVPRLNHSRIFLCEVGSGRVVESVASPGRVVAIDFAEDGELIALAYSHGLIEVRRAAEFETVLVESVLVPDDRLRAARHLNAVRFLPGGESVVVAAGDGLVRVWDWRRDEVVRVLAGHRDRVICMDLSADARTLVTGSRDGEVRFWSLESGETTRAIDAHEDSVEGVALSPDGSLVVTVSRDDTVRVWDARTGEGLAVRREHTHNVAAVRFRADGGFVTSSWDSTVRTWDADGFAERACFHGHTREVRQFDLVPGRDQAISCSPDGTVRSWDLGEPGVERRLRGHNDIVTALAFSADGRRIASGSGQTEGAVRVWDLETLTCLAETRTMYRPVNDVSFRDGVALAIDAAHRPLELRESGEAVAGFAERVGVPLSELDAGRWLMAMRPNLVTVREGASWALVKECFSTPSPIVSAARRARTNEVAVGLDDGQVQVWDWESGRLLRTAAAVEGKLRRVHFTPDGERLLVAAGRRVHVLDANTLKPDGVLSAHVAAVHAIASSPDHRRIATAAADGTVRLWDASSLRQLLVLRASADAATCVQFSADGRYLAAGGGAWDAPGDLVIWEAPPPEE